MEGFHLERYGGKLLILSNLQQRNAKQLVIQDPFVKGVIEYWTIISYCEENLDSESAYIWYNSLIYTIEKKPFFYKSWFNAGVHKVADLLNKDGSFFSFDEFMENRNIKTKYLDYFEVISALRQFMKMCLPLMIVLAQRTLWILVFATQTVVGMCTKVSLRKRKSHITSKKSRQMDERPSDS